MERVLLARHAESDLSVVAIVNGDPVVRCGLTPLGSQQAEGLRDALAGQRIDLVVTSDFERCRRTAEIVVAGRRVRLLELPELGDVRSGRFEGGELAAYRAWAHVAAGEEPAPGGGESRVAAARRFAAGARTVLAQPERTALVITHQVVVDYLVRGAAGENPSKRVAAVPYASPVELDVVEVERAVGTLEAWAANPDW